MNSEQATCQLKNLGLQQVYTFFHVVEQGSITKAAALMNLTQAAVSRIIAHMETDLRLILFIRQVRGVVPTPAAKILYKEWKKAVRQLECAYTEAYQAQLGLVRHISLGSIYYEQELSHHIALVDWFEREFPETVLHTDYCSIETLREGLISGKYDAIIINALEAGGLQERGIRYRTLRREPCSFYIDEGNPLYFRDEVAFSDLRQQQVVVPASQEVLRSPELQAFCREHCLDGGAWRFIPDYLEALIVFFREAGVILSEGLLRKTPMENCRQIQIPGLYSGLGVAWTDDVNPVLKRMIRFLQELEGASGGGQYQ